MIKKAEDLVFDESQLNEFLKECRKKSKKIVFASGVYDILHIGHLRFLEKARDCGDVLIVGINDDIFAKKKGENRPIQNEYNRASLVAGFECVSCVHIFDNGDDAMDILRLVRPDIYVMSTTSTKKPKERSHHFELMKKMGGTVVVFDACSTSHSTSIIEHLKAQE
jgi:D-glycero-beta-D-manno-heptose 1-phosphate adenylyltransferase